MNMKPCFILEGLTIVLVAATCVRGQACTSGFKPGPTCPQYYQCNNGQWLLRDCPAGTEWNNNGQYCDWPASSGCSGGSTSTSTQAPPPSSTTSGPAPSTTTQSSGGALITLSEFNAAAATKGGHPDVSYYNGFINSLSRAQISTRTEAAKFLAHSCWETVGYQYTREVYCQTNMDACRNAYPNNNGGLPNQVYYGRGMLQLTWDYNYKAASSALYGDDRLIQNPDQVASDPAIGWSTAAWFWSANVHAVAGTFGGTLKAINGALECDGGSNSQNMMLRFNHYKQILSILNLPIPPDSDGYCHA